MAKVCIICLKEVAFGYPVEDDVVIRAIRAAKRRLNIAKNNELAVCEGCLEAYRQKRKKYERDLAIHVVIAAVVLLVFAILPIATTGFSPWSILLGFALALLLIALSVFSHCPRVAGLDASTKSPAGGPAHEGPQAAVSRQSPVPQEPEEESKTDSIIESAFAQKGALLSQRQASKPKPKPKPKRAGRSKKKK